MTDIVETDGTLGGQARIDGTRVSVQQVVEMHTERDMTPDEIADELPTVSTKDIRAAIADADTRDILSQQHRQNTGHA